MNTPSICPLSKRDHWPKPVVLPSSSTSIASKWNILSEFFISYTNTTISALATTLSSMMHGSNVPKEHVGKRVCTIINDNITLLTGKWATRTTRTWIEDMTSLEMQQTRCRPPSSLFVNEDAAKRIQNEFKPANHVPLYSSIHSFHRSTIERWQINSKKGQQIPKKGVLPFNFYKYWGFLTSRRGKK